MLPLVLLFLAASLVDLPDEEQLARKIKKGDAGAFRTFFDRHHALLYRFLRSRGVDGPVAEDLIQNAFLFIWERRDEIEPGRSLRSYLFRICHSRALNHFRDTARLTGTDELDDRRSEAASPEAVAAGTLLHEHLQAAVDGLPERRRAVFELCFMEGFTYREAAAALDISQKTVENQMGHALKAVRGALVAYREAYGAP